MKQIIVTTGSEIPGKKVVKIQGIVMGSTVRAKNFVRDIFALMKHMLGGEVKTYTEMVNQARDESYNRMINQAIEMGADAIIEVDFNTAVLLSGTVETLAYGTAVKLK